MLVRFLKSWRNYNRGETAAFVDHVAEELVEGGWAVPFEAEDAADAVSAKLPVQGGDGADTLTGGDGADSVAGGDPVRPDKPAASGLPKQGAGK